MGIKKYDGGKWKKNVMENFSFPQEVEISVKYVHQLR